MRSRAHRHTQSKGRLHQGYMSLHVKCVCVFQMVSWTVSTQTVVVSRCVWAPRCAKARLTHVTSSSRATPLLRHALHVSSSNVCDSSSDGTAHTYYQETCHLTAGDKHTPAIISSVNTHANIILLQGKHTWSWSFQNAQRFVVMIVIKFTLFFLLNITLVLFFLIVWSHWHFG